MCIFYVCKLLTICYLNRYKPHLPNRQQWLNAKIVIIFRLSKEYGSFNFWWHTNERTNSLIFYFFDMFTSELFREGFLSWLSAQIEAKSTRIYLRLSRFLPYFHLIWADMLQYSLFKPFIESWCEHVYVALGKSEPTGFCAPWFHGRFYFVDNTLGFVSWKNIVSGWCQ